jgi:predicted transcriptional regulator of viral defense system
MHTNYKGNLRTIGPRTAKLLNGLHDRSQTTFTLLDVKEITGLEPALASSLLNKAVRRGLVSRLKGGLYMVIPAELGSTVEYGGNPYIVARSLAGNAPAYLSYATAMEIHRMVTQPQFVIFVATTKRLRNRIVKGTEFRFMLIKAEHFFGTTRHWVTKQESVEISDLERTLIDGLHHPEYCGGVTEVAKGLWMRHPDINATKLVEYALRLRVGAVIRRLGFLLELYRIGSNENLQPLQKALTATYVLLDPILPKEGKHSARWRLQLNISPDELEAVRVA